MFNDERNLLEIQANFLNEKLFYILYVYLNLEIYKKLYNFLKRWT